MTRILLASLALAVATGCGSPRHMQYDFGRAFISVTSAQADLTRPAASESAFPLSGTEAEAIRILVVESATDANTGKSELTN